MYATPTVDSRSSKRRKSLSDFSNEDFRIIRRDKKRKQMQQQESVKVKRYVKNKKKCLPIRHADIAKRRQYTKARRRLKDTKKTKNEPPKSFYTPPPTNIRQRNIPPITVSQRKRMAKPDLAAAIAAANIAATKTKQKADEEKAAEETRHKAQKNVEEAKRENNKGKEKKSMVELVNNILNLHTNKCIGSYYKILCVERTASLDDIKKGYKKLALKLHPDKDKYSTPNIEEAFKVVGNIYELLTDPISRKRYDDGESKRQQKEEQRQKPQETTYIPVYYLNVNIERKIAEELDDKGYLSRLEHHKKERIHFATGDSFNNNVIQKRAQQMFQDILTRAFDDVRLPGKLVVMDKPGKKFNIEDDYLIRTSTNEEGLPKWSWYFQTKDLNSYGCLLDCVGSVYAECEVHSKTLNAHVLQYESKRVVLDDDDEDDMYGFNEYMKEEFEYEDSGSEVIGYGKDVINTNILGLQKVKELVQGSLQKSLGKVHDKPRIISISIGKDGLHTWTWSFTSEKQDEYDCTWKCDGSANIVVEQIPNPTIPMDPPFNPQRNPNQMIPSTRARRWVDIGDHSTDRKMAWSYENWVPSFVTSTANTCGWDRC